MKMSLLGSSKGDLSRLRIRSFSTVRDHRTSEQMLTTPSILASLSILSFPSTLFSIQIPDLQCHSSRVICSEHLPCRRSLCLSWNLRLQNGIERMVNIVLVSTSLLTMCCRDLSFRRSEKTKVSRETRISIVDWWMTV